MAKIYLLLEITFGILIFVRISGEFVAKNIISTRVMTKIVSLYLCWLVVCLALLIKNLILNSILILFPVFLIFFVPTVIKILRKNRFYQDILPFLNSCILKMRAGESFRQAMQQSISQMSKISRPVAQQAIELSLLESQTKSIASQNIEVLKFMDEIKFINNEQHKRMIRLIQYRDRIRLERVIKKRVNTALSQLRAQILVLSVLYILTLIYLFTQERVQIEWPAIVLSFVLFIGGLGVNLFVLRRKCWKV